MRQNIKSPYFLRILSFILVSGFFAMQSPALAQISPPDSGAGSNSSYNWAGYVASGAGYTSVSGNWTVPQIPSTTNFTADASWIGIGGVNNTDLIQTGTQAITSGSSATYQAWYEMLPAVSQPISITVNPGDSISASIAESGTNQWTISLRDNTNGQNFQTVVSYDSSGSNAEWIEEMPSQGNNAFIPLDNFGTIQFSGAAATRNGQTLTPSQLGAQTMSMINTNGQILAEPSALGSDGASFTVSRSSAAPSTSTFTPYGRRGWSRVGVGVRGFGTRTNFQTRRARPESFQIAPGMTLNFFTRFSRKR